MAAAGEVPTLLFENASHWEAWLREHHAELNGVWIKLAKKASGIPSVTYGEALDVALCFGWIDGQKKALDGSFFLQRFTPRRPRSLWSKRNTTRCVELTVAGKMQPSGLAEVEAAKRDGRWDAAYDSPKTMVLPDDFLTALEKNHRALTFFNTLSQSNKYGIAWRLQTARTPETRMRRFEALIAMLDRGESLH